MTKNIALSRPAMSAIAAFMVLSTPSAFAQEAPTITMTPPVAAPTPQTPPTVAPPSAPAPVAVPQAAQPPVAAPVIRVPLDIAPAETAPTPRATARATERAAAPARTQRTAERARPAAAIAVAAPVAAAPAADAAPVAEMTPIAAPVMAPVETAAEAAPPPAATTTTPASDFPWEIAGGAAALLLVGGAGLAFARRRRADRVVIDEAPAYEAPILAREAVVTAEPAASDSQAWITPAYAPREQAAPAPRTTPAFAAAPSGSMGRHEAMAMTGPTPENPFATLNKRLKRARFMDRQERVAYDDTLGQQKDMSRTPVSAWEIAQRPAPAMQEQEVRRAEPARPRTSTTFRPGYSNS